MAFLRILPAAVTVSLWLAFLSCTSVLLNAQSPVKQVHQSEPGPWGNLEYYYTYLEAPEQTIRMMSVPSQQTEWKFPGISPDQQAGIYREAGLTEDQIAELMDPQRRIDSPSLLRTFPSSKLLLSLTPQTRSALYHRLGQWKENQFHFRPIVFEQGDIREWFADSGMEPELLQAFEALAWKRDNVLLFSDVPYLLSLVATSEEHTTLLRGLTRTRTMILRLKLSPESDVDVLSEYWTGGHKHQDILPLLESIIRTEGVERLDVAHLLPPLPRKHLYAFPSPVDGLQGQFPGGFWTSVNFFNLIPRHLYGATPELDQTVRSDFIPIQPPFRFGDILFVARQTDRAVMHACVFIADDIVFTKNSADMFSPWILMKMDDMLTHHRKGQSIFLNGWRSRGSVYTDETMNYSPEGTTSGVLQEDAAGAIP